MFTPGSGIYFDTGRTIHFNVHQDAYNYFGVTGGGALLNENMCKKAASAGYDSIQFVRWYDHVNYPCDTFNTGRPGLAYMGVEIVATRLVGTYTCTTSAGAPNNIRAGWLASRVCNCDNSYQFLNCDGVPRLSVQDPPAVQHK